MHNVGLQTNISASGSSSAPSAPKNALSYANSASLGQDSAAFGSTTPRFGFGGVCESILSCMCCILLIPIALAMVFGAKALGGIMRAGNGAAKAAKNGANGLKTTTSKPPSATPTPKAPPTSI
ncbi:MAG: hypothetical protein KTR14_00265 [Vampirovibrio sp.]|nr:hypothetical protein [Vampirovibrio sp.]